MPRRSTAAILFRVAAVGSLLIGAVAVVFAAFAGGVGAAGLAYLSKDLPSPQTITDRDLFQTVKVYDRSGELLAELWDTNEGKRSVVRLTGISPAMIAATLAIEDARFYQNPGFDLEAIARAFRQNYEGGNVVSGASTITMQLVRNALFDEQARTEQSYTRKLREVILAYQITQQFTKDQILEMYFNEIYYGNLAYGVETAARAYFNKPAKGLTLAEAAMLAGLPQAPSRYDPFTNFVTAKERQEQVLDAMVYHEFVTQEEADAVKKQEIKLVQQTYGVKAPHFVQYVKDFLLERYGRERLFSGGWQVYTTLDLGMQAKAEKAAREHIATIRKLNANNAAVVAIDARTAEIRVMVGSLDFYDKSIDGEVNIAISDRQPGSALKPFNYLTNFAQMGVTPSTVIYDQPTLFPDELGRNYSLLNHDRSWHGPVSARRALSSSLNMPAVIMLQNIGIPAFLETLHKAGITSLNNPHYGLAVTLGAGEVKLLDLTYAYTIFPNNGYQVGAPVPLQFRQPGMREYEPVAIARIVDSKGETVYEYQPQGKQLFPPQYAFFVNTILADDDARSPTYGPNSFLVLPRPVAAKTGTTESYQDGWTVGYTPDLVTGVWVGNADNTPMKGVMGVSGAGYIWHNFMEDALKDQPVKDFIIPEGVVKMPALETEPVSSIWQIRDDWFLASSVPPRADDGRPTGTIVRVGLRPLARDLDQPLAPGEKPRMEAYAELIQFQPTDVTFLPIRPREVWQKVSPPRSAIVPYTPAPVKGEDSPATGQEQPAEAAVPGGTAPAQAEPAADAPAPPASAQSL